MSHTDRSARETLLRIARLMPVRMGLLYVLLTYAYLSGFFFRSTMAQGPVAMALATVMVCGAMLAVYAAVVHFVERRPVGELALPGRGREFGLGLLLGAGLYTVCVLVLVALGHCRIEATGAWQVLLPGFLLAIGTGFYEELWFRGGVFRLTEEWFGSWIAIVVSSAAFGWVHLSTEGATVLDVTFIAIEAGLLLAAAYMLTGRLWLGIGFHGAWNFTQGSVFSGAVSGNAAPQGLFRTTMTGPELLTGGSFGMEASLVALVLMTGTGLVMLAMAVRRGRIVPPAWMRRR